MKRTAVQLTCKKHFPFPSCQIHRLYKSNLYVCNFSVYSFKYNVRRKFVWDKIVQGKGSYDHSSIVARHKIHLNQVMAYQPCLQQKMMKTIGKVLKRKERCTCRKLSRERKIIKCNKFKASSETYCSIVDLQKYLLFLKFLTSINYHKRNLYVSNLRVYCFNKNGRYKYVWGKIEGGRGFHDLSSIAARHQIHIDR